MANLYGFHDTAACLKALQALLAAIQFNAAPAFPNVIFFDLMDPLKALQEVHKMPKRVCAIVHAGERFTNTKAGPRVLRVQKIDDLTIIVGDHNVADRQLALLGAPAPSLTVGALPLKDAILNSVCGLLPGVNGVFVRPVHGEQFMLQQKMRDELQGRVFYNLNLELVGGNQEFDLGQQPIF